MAQKPEIQYIGQFYVYGSEARAEERKTRGVSSALPRMRPRANRVHKVYIDPVALGGIAVALVMLVVLVLGAVQLHSNWRDYSEMSTYLSQLKRENAQLEHSYRTQLDLSALEDAAGRMGYVSQEEVTTMTISVTVPPHKTGPSVWENLVWFFSGLLSDGA